MPELTDEEATRGGIGTSHVTCETCEAPVRKDFCGRHDEVFYSCRCPFKPEPENPYHRDHSDCGPRR